MLPLLCIFPPDSPPASAHARLSTRAARQPPAGPRPRCLCPTLRNPTAGTNDNHATLWDERQWEQRGSLKWLSHLPRLKFCLTGLQFYLSGCLGHRRGCMCVTLHLENLLVLRAAAAIATTFITWLRKRIYFSNLCLLWQCLHSHGDMKPPPVPVNLLTICNCRHEREGSAWKEPMFAVWLYRNMAFMVLSNLT